MHSNKHRAQNTVVHNIYTQKPKVCFFIMILRFAFKRAASKRTFYVSKRTFAVSKRTFAVSERIVFPRDMSCLGGEIDMFSWLKRNVWLLYLQCEPWY